MNKEKGDKYEIQIRDYIINELGKPAYLWSHTPETILIDNEIIGSHNDHRLRRKENLENSLQDTGIDIIQVEKNNKCSLVQCKNGYKSGVTMKDLAGFMCWIASLVDLCGYVYYTNKLSENVKCLPPNKRINYVKKEYIEPEETEINNDFEPDREKLLYQNKAKKLATKYYKDNDHGILSMPCGTGKTYVSYLISQGYKQIIILSPLKQFAKQNLDRFGEYGYSSQTLLVDSDGERDVKEIRKFIENNKSFLISATYDSIDVIWKATKYMKKPFFIIDEFHNLSKSNVTDENDDFNKLLVSENKILFMSATPRVYEMEDDDDYFSDMFGETIYHMSFTEAIDKKYITDYKIWLPLIHEDNSELDKELSIYEIDKTIQAKCKFLFSCLVNNGSRKCIVYCQNTSEIESMRESMKKLNDFYCLDIKMSQITSIDSAEERKKRLKFFEESEKIRLLFSVRILDECVDIPSCDSIFITYPTQSKIRTIQRLCRCIRIDKNNKFKIGNIYIWCDEYDQIINTLSGIKEYDMNFKEKIGVNANDWFRKKNNENIDGDMKIVKKYVVGIKEFRQISWREKLAQVKEYMDENKKRPSTDDKYVKIKQLAQWISDQQKNYQNKINIMRNEEIYEEWKEFVGEYNKYFLSNEEQWREMQKKVKKYMDENKKRPSDNNKDVKIRQLAKWISHQQMNYQNKTWIMKNDEIYEEWTKFVKEYKIYFLSDKEQWKTIKKKVEKYMDENKKRPSRHNKDVKIKQLAQWISRQQNHYQNKTYIMKNKEIYDEWTRFVKEYQIYSNEEQWKEMKEKVKKYMDEYKKKPSQYDKDAKIKQLAQWISDQRKKYQNRTWIMQNEVIYAEWTKFVKEYHIYSNEEQWKEMKKQVKKYMNENKKRPSQHNKDVKIKQLGNWIITQKKNYQNKINIMQNIEISKEWKEFVKEYQIYFKSN